MSVKEKLLAPADWEFTSPSERLYTSDHVIDAYLTGKKEGLEQNDRLIIEKLIANVNLSGEHTNELFTYLKSINIKPVDAYLRINSWDDFSLMLILSEIDFLSKKIDQVYNYISSFEERIGSDFYNLSLSILDVDGDVDTKCLKSDGYSLKHKQK